MPPASNPVDELHIRRLGVADLAAYRDFRLRALEATPLAFTSNAADERAAPQGLWEKRLDDAERSVIFGAFAAGALVGIAGLRWETERQARHKGTLFGMAVDASVAGRGVGGALVRRILDEAGRRGLRQVILTYSEGNTAAEHLYSRQGFVVFGREPRAVIVGGQDIVKVHMIRLLEAGAPRSGSEDQVRG